MSKLGLSNNQRCTCFKGKQLVGKVSWFDEAVTMGKPWEKFNNSYTRLCKLIDDLGQGDV